MQCCFYEIGDYSCMSTLKHQRLFIRACTSRTIQNWFEHENWRGSILNAYPTQGVVPQNQLRKIVSFHKLLLSDHICFESHRCPYNHQLLLLTYIESLWSRFGLETSSSYWREGPFEVKEELDWPMPPYHACIMDTEPITQERYVCYWEEKEHQRRP